jgi:tRNA nucleotidyltransferase (CCA-adding enzyme)
MIEQAKAFAERIEREAGTDPTEQVRFAYQVAYGRPVAEKELQIAVRYLQLHDSPEDKAYNKLTRIERYAQALLASNEFMYLD